MLASSTFSIEIERLGRHPAREAGAQGNADSALDLLLDSLGRPSDELARLLVEKEDGCRVRVECGADADEQLVEQLVEREMRQRGLHDGLELP
jgi:hypothetical protein